MKSSIERFKDGFSHTIISAEDLGGFIGSLLSVLLVVIPIMILGLLILKILGGF